MPRWLAHLLVVLGWLVTPLLAWAAAYAGLWVGALVGTRFAQPLTMLAVAGLGAASFGFAALAMWVRFMRRVPHPHPLDIAHGWTPVTAVDRVADSACRNTAARARGAMCWVRKCGTRRM